MSLEFSVWFETLEGVRSGYRSLLSGRPKGRAGRHQWRVDLRRAFVQFPGERTYVPACGDAEVFALESHLHPARCRSCSRNSGENVSISSAVAFSRIHDCSSPAQAVQNGSVRLHAVDNMAKRACGRRARIGRNAAIRSLGSRAASSATIQPSTVNPRIESSLLGSASTRDPLFSSNARRRCRFRVRRPP